MRYDWMLEVLADLRAFARDNGLTALAAQLEETAAVATAEIARLGDGLPGGEGPGADEAGGPGQDDPTSGGE
jgi:hypothetical protein